MKISCLALALSLLPMASLADPGPATGSTSSIPVTISAKGEEVRTVLMSLFDQEKKQYVIESSTHYSVFLSLDKADFHRALDIVCGLAGLQADLRDGIYFVHTAVHAQPKAEPQPAPIHVSVTEHPAAPKPAPAPAKPVVLGPVPSSELQKHVTTRLKKVALKTLFDELSKQTGVKIVIDEKVPAYKLDAYLINTSLRYALNSVTKAAGLTWKLPQDRTVLITAGAATMHS